MPPGRKMAEALLERLGQERQVRAPEAFLRGLSSEPIRSVIEIGAFEGEFAERALRLFPNSTVYAIEPLPSSFAQLQACAERYGERLRPFQLALGDSRGTAQLIEQVGLGRASSMHRLSPAGTQLFGAREQRPIEVPMCSLDDFWQDHRPPGPLLVNMSVQGLEREVLAGGQACLASASVCLVYLQLDALFEEAVPLAEVALGLSGCGLHYAGTLEQRHYPDGRAYGGWCAFRRTSDVE